VSMRFDAPVLDQWEEPGSGAFARVEADCRAVAVDQGLNITGREQVALDATVQVSGCTQTPNARRGSSAQSFLVVRSHPGAREGSSGRVGRCPFGSRSLPLGS
jgi:hypothetical protein